MTENLPVEILRFKKISKGFFFAILGSIGAFLVFSIWGIIGDKIRESRGEYVSDGGDYVLMAAFFLFAIVASILTVIMIIFWVIYRIKRASYLKSQGTIVPVFSKIQRIIASSVALAAEIGVGYFLITDSNIYFDIIGGTLFAILMFTTVIYLIVSCSSKN
jgi:hypothetical protein